MTDASFSASPVVIDASVALKWQLDDERDSGQALKLRDDILVTGRITAYAPSLYFYELTNGIVSAIRRRRLERTQGEEALRNLFSIEVILRTPSVERTFAIATDYGLSAYDSSYIALAETLEAELWTADRQLFDAVDGREQSVRWLGDYPAQPAN